MNTNYPVSGYDKTRDLVYFARMCSKARLKAQGQLPEDYHRFLGEGFDGRCCRFLGVSYDDIKRLIGEGLSDEAILDWCLANGRKPNDEEIFIWNLFMEKRGWRDDDSFVVAKEKKRLGLERRDDVQTIMDLFDFEEGRRA